MLLFITLPILSYIFYRLYQHFCQTSGVDPDGKYVLVTGCDTGVGHALVMELDKQGFNVLAGVYIPENISLVKEKLSFTATVFHLDITKQEDIDATFELVQNKTNTLHALVNNAGIIAHGCIDWTPVELLRRIMDVNFFGHVAMTKKFLPLLITKRFSRVVNICSASGVVSFPNTSAYATSKSALGAFSDCLRREMFPWGLHVSAIEPGTLRTAMTEGYEDSWRNLWNTLSVDIQERWGSDFLDAVVTVGINSPFIKHADDPYKVVRAVQHAVTNRNPQIRYRPGWQAKVIFILYWFPVWLIDRILAKALYFIPAGVRNQL